MQHSEISPAALRSFRDHPLVWDLVRSGLKLGAVALFCIAGGFSVITLSGPALGPHLGETAVRIAAVAGVAATLIGVLVGLAALGHCLMAPYPPARMLLLAGFLVATYAMHSALFRILTPFGRAQEAPAGEKMIQELTRVQTAGTALYAVANLLMVASLLAIATYIGSREQVRRIQRFWLYQFGGVIVLFGVGFGIQLLFGDVEDAGDGLLISLITVIITIAYAAAIIVLEAAVCRALARDLGDVAEAVKKQSDTGEEQSPGDGPDAMKSLWNVKDSE